MILDDIGIGTRLELELIDKDGKKIGKTFISQVYEPLANNSMLILSPIFESRLIYIPVNALIRLAFFHKKHGLMSFTATVVSREMRGNIGILAIRPESDAEAIQRREHYRLLCNMNAGYIVKDENATEKDVTESAGGNLKEKPKVQYKKALTKNISGSGACIIAEEDLPKDTVLELRLEISPTVAITALCVVMRNTRVEVKKAMNYELGLHFTKISSRDQDHIIKYIFEQQRVLLKKEILDK